MTEDDIQWLARHIPHGVLFFELTLVLIWQWLILLAEAQP